jgi:phosphoribosylformylglycinamidine cyclo-ligase
MKKVEIHGMAHITGGGFYENIPRMFAPRETSHNGMIFDAVINGGSWAIPPVFARIAAGCTDPGLSGPAAQKRGEELLKNDEALKRLMFNTFNMGIGFVLAVAPADVRRTVEHLDDMGFPAWEIGRVTAADTNAKKGELRFA